MRVGRRVEGEGGSGRAGRGRRGQHGARGAGGAREKAGGGQADGEGGGGSGAGGGGGATGRGGANIGRTRQRRRILAQWHAGSRRPPSSSHILHMFTTAVAIFDTTSSHPLLSPNSPPPRHLIRALHPSRSPTQALAQANLSAKQRASTTEVSFQGVLRHRATDDN